MRIVIMGTGPFAVPTSEQLRADGHEIVLVVTRPLVDPKAKKLPPRPVFEWASQLDMEIFEPASINTPSAIDKLVACRADLFFVCDYGQILSNDCLSASRLGGINLHGSLLPRHRGAAPVQWALMSGDTEAGVTVIHMTPKLDAGPALAIARTEILPDETAEQLEPRLAKLGVAATQQAIAILREWDGVSAIGQMQDKSLVTKAPRFSKSDGQLNFSVPAAQLVRQVRACQPWPGTFAELHWPNGKSLRVQVKAARSADKTIDPLAGLQPGAAVAVDSEVLNQSGELSTSLDWSPPWHRLIAVATTGGTFFISRIQPAGKREMDVAEFLRGHPLTNGAGFE